LDAGDTEIEAVIRHSEGNSMQWNVGSDNESIFNSAALGLSANKYLGCGLWIYGDGADWRSPYLSLSGNSVAQYSPAITDAKGSGAAAWSRANIIARVTAVNPVLGIYAGWAPTGIRYTDDFYAIALDDVTLTVTPASQANSLEGTGIRVDGLDRLTQPIINMKLNKGVARFPYTPRHSAATVALFGNATPVICHLYADANNYILLDWSAANTIRLRYNAGGAGVQTGTWNATGLIVAGTQYILEISYTGSVMYLKINTVTVITILAPTIFTVIPTTANWLHDNVFAQQNDAVIG
jgi:hypothetical protein